MIIRRRTVLLAGLGAALVGCSSPPVPSTPPPDPAELAGIESRFGGRLGLYALDTGTGRAVGHRADERFLMCSTTKVPLIALVLRRSVEDTGLLDRRIRWTRDDLLEYAPVTTPNLATGMTVAELCAAAVTVSDNTAANLLFAQVGGPQAVTAFVRGLGDPLSRFDRVEPALNDTAPGDGRDTTTPARFAETLRLLTLGDALPPPQRDRLVGWMDAATTGAAQIRAGVPAGWRVGDKTGSGNRGESNDVGVVSAPGRAPIVVTVFTAPSDPDSTAGKPTIAAATRAALAALGG
ncbi:class A beta-lactamase [Pseudonocardia endophytica]|uniref:class A beta-lactamase n=1 Tax=Pseudonocardia endophytica TaxID=401976 RepID=UPI00104392B3